MLHSGYRLFEFISISNILRKAAVKYDRSFRYTETDDNDLTYEVVTFFLKSIVVGKGLCCLAVLRHALINRFQCLGAVGPAAAGVNVG